MPHTMEGYSLSSGSTILVYFFSVLVKFKDVPEATSASGHHKASWISAIHHTSFLSLMMSPLFLVHTTRACGSSSYLQENTVCRFLTHLLFHSYNQSDHPIFSVSAYVISHRAHGRSRHGSEVKDP